MNNKSPNKKIIRGDYIHYRFADVGTGNYFEYQGGLGSFAHYIGVIQHFADYENQLRKYDIHTVWDFCGY